MEIKLGVGVIHALPFIAFWKIAKRGSGHVWVFSIFHWHGNVVVVCFESVDGSFQNESYFVRRGFQNVFNSGGDNTISKLDIVRGNWLPAGSCVDNQCFGCFTRKMHDVDQIC